MTVMLACTTMLPAFTGAVYAADKPKLEATGAVLYCENTGQYIYEKNADKEYDPYSMTKVVTAYLVSQNIEDWDTEVTISEKAASIGGSSMDLQEGEVVTIEQLMYGMMLLSGNDAAYALGEAVGGDMDTFIDMMNALAMEQGCSHTHFTNCYGWQGDQHYTSARDFLKLSRLAMSDKRVYKVMATKKYKMPATNKSEARTMKTHVPLITVEDSGVVAGKTGYWDDWDCSAMVRYDKNDLRMTMVILKDTDADRKDDMLKLLNYGTKEVKGYAAVTEGEASKTVRVRHSANIKAPTAATKTVYAYPATGNEEDITTKVVFNEKVEAPLAAGDEVGRIEVYANGELAVTSPIAVTEDVATGWLPSYLYISNKGTVAIIVTVLLIATLIFIRRRLRAARRRKKARQIAERELRIERRAAELRAQMAAEQAKTAERKTQFLNQPSSRKGGGKGGAPNAGQK